MVENTNQRVLYIEDEQALCDLFILALQPHGYTVDTALTAKRGIELQNERPYDLIAIDYELPDMTGIQAAQELLAKSPNLPLLLVTGQGSEKLAIEAFTMGFSNYVVKEDASIYVGLIPSIVKNLLVSVTEKRQRLEAERSLAEKELQLRSIFESTSSGVISIDQSGLIQMANPAISKLFGYTEAELLGNNVTLLMPTAFKPKHDAAISAYLETGKAKVIGKGQEFEGIHKDGTVFPIHLTISTATINNAKIFTGVITDLTERVNAERTRVMLEAGLEHIDEALALFDKNDNLIFCNRKYTHYYYTEMQGVVAPGITYEHMIRTAAELGFYDTEGTTNENIIKHLLKLHKNTKKPYELKTSDGRWMSYRESKTNDGGLVLLRQDVTKLKLAQEQSTRLNVELEERVRERTEQLLKKINEQQLVEEALRVSETRVRTIVESVNDGIITIDDSNAIESFNGGAQLMFGYELNEVLGEKISKLVAPSERANHDYDTLDYLTKPDDDGTDHSYIEITAIRKNGTEFPVEVSLKELNIGRSRRYVGTVRDLTERHAAEKERFEIESRFRAVVDSSPSAIAIKDTDGKVILTNNRWHQWFNPKNEDVSGKISVEYFPEKHSGSITQQDIQVLNSGRTNSKEYEMRLADGRTISSLMQKFPIIDNKGDVIAVGGMLTDISELKKAEEERRVALIEAERASMVKSEFLAAMSHELRTPLNAILGFSDVISNQYMGPIDVPVYIDYANDIHASSERLLSLVNNILDLTTIEAGSLQLEKEYIIISDIVEECTNAIFGTQSKNQIELIKHVPESTPPLYADKRALKQICINLLSNALQATPDGGTITVSVQSMEGHHQLIISDTGPGISEEKLKTLTQAFVRVETDPHHAQGGAGLGLAIIQSLVDLHEGTMEISSSIGEGTSVTITLPSG